MKQPRRKCLNCREHFTPYQNGQVVCSFSCASAYRQKHPQKTRESLPRKAKLIQRKQLASRSAPSVISVKSARPLSHWLDLTQRPVNELRRLTCLANGDGCISCGTHHSPEWHAGHYRTIAAAGHLRFEPDNIWLQCCECNIDKSGNRVAFRAALVALIGEKRVLVLDNDNSPHRWNREELKTIRLRALADLRTFKKIQEAA